MCEIICLWACLIAEIWYKSDATLSTILWTAQKRRTCHRENYRARGACGCIMSPVALGGNCQIWVCNASDVISVISARSKFVRQNGGMISEKCENKRAGDLELGWDFRIQHLRGWLILGTFWQWPSSVSKNTGFWFISQSKEMLNIQLASIMFISTFGIMFVLKSIPNF